MEKEISSSLRQSLPSNPLFGLLKFQFVVFLVIFLVVGVEPYVLSKENIYPLISLIMEACNIQV